MRNLLRRNGIFYARIFIPGDLHPIFGRKEVVRSLGTSDRDDAELLTARLRVRSTHLFALARRRPSMSPEQLRKLANEFFTVNFAKAQDDWRRRPLSNDAWENELAEWDGQLATLERGLRTNRFAPIREGLEAFLVAKGIRLDRDSPEFRELSQLAMRAQIAAHREVIRQAEGQFRPAPWDESAVPVPTRPAGGAPSSSPGAPAARVSDLFEDWAILRRSSTKAVATWRTAVRRFT